MSNVMNYLDNLLTEKQMWSGDVKSKWTPPEGFFTRSAEKIASGLKRSSENLKQAMARLNFYRNRSGKNLSAEDKARLKNAAEKLRNLYPKNEATETATKTLYVIMGQLGSRTPERLDTSDDEQGADYLVQEYRMAFGPKWKIWKEIDKESVNESDMKKIRNWIIRCYDKNDKEIESFIIKDRTEHEAEREAESDPRVLKADDWTMTIKK
jgi:hypothetical protein